MASPWRRPESIRFFKSLMSVSDWLIHETSWGFSGGLIVSGNTDGEVGGKGEGRDGGKKEVGGVLEGGGTGDETLSTCLHFIFCRLHFVLFCWSHFILLSLLLLLFAFGLFC